MKIRIAVFGVLAFVTILIVKPNQTTGSEPSDAERLQAAATQPATTLPTTAPVRFEPPDWVRSALHLHIIGIALMKYVKDKGSYPDALSDLKSDDVSADTLTCPVDGKPYVYRKPASSDAPPHTVVAYEGTPSRRNMVNILCADGDVEGFRAVDAKGIIDKGQR
jgi:hypothetical protein